MEIMYPIVIIICLIIGIAIFFINFNNKSKYTNGKKVANTKYIKETSYYKERIRRYKLLSTLLKITSVICIVTASMLIARFVTIQTKSDEKYNRDILIGLDISTSESETNLELIKKFKKIIPSIEGDRVGIVLFNTAPIVYCPLTDDYEYINECLDKIEKQMKIEINSDGEVPASNSEENNESYVFWYGGAVANADTRGSSLIGDGLARNYFFISRCKKR